MTSTAEASGLMRPNWLAYCCVFIYNEKDFLLNLCEN